MTSWILFFCGFDNDLFYNDFKGALLLGTDHFFARVAGAKS